MFPNDGRERERKRDRKKGNTLGRLFICTSIRRFLCHKMQLKWFNVQSLLKVNYDKGNQILQGFIVSVLVPNVKDREGFWE